MKKHWISVKRGLSEDPKHRQAMGEAIWLFLHIVDAADWDKGMVYDWRDKEIAAEMSLSAATVRGWRDRLAKNGYITCNQKQYGLEIVIHNWIDPRNYSGKVMNKRQGDSYISPSKDEDDAGCAQVDTQVDTQVLDEPIVNPASFIESTSTSESKSTSQQPTRSFSPVETAKLKNEYMESNTVPYRKAHVMLMNVSSLPAIPRDQEGYIDTVQAMIGRYGEEATKEALQRACLKWITTQGKNGRNYSKTNFKWVDWAMDGISGGGKAVDPAMKTHNELMAMIRGEA